MKVDNIIFMKLHHIQAESYPAKEWENKIGNGTITTLHMFSLLDLYAFANVIWALYVMIMLCMENLGNQILYNFESFIIDNFCGKSYQFLVLDSPEIFKKLLISPLFSLLWCFLQFCKWNDPGHIFLPSFCHVGFLASYVIWLNSETICTSAILLL